MRLAAPACALVGWLLLGCNPSGGQASVQPTEAVEANTRVAPSPMSASPGPASSGAPATASTPLPPSTAASATAAKKASGFSGPCGSSVDCLQRGRCVQHDPAGDCAPTRHEHCAQSEDCRRYGLCSYRQPRMHCSPQDLLCRMAYAKQSRCEAASDADCRRSAACNTDKRCKATGGKCTQ